MLIPIDPKHAEVLSDDATGAPAGRVVDRVLRRVLVDQLFEAIALLKDEAHARGLTDAIIDEELAAHKAARCAAADANRAVWPFSTRRRWSAL